MGHQKPVITGRVENIQRSETTIGQIAAERRQSTQYGIKAIVCFEIFWWAAYATYHRITNHSHLWAFLPGIAGAYGGSLMRGVVENLRQKK